MKLPVVAEKMKQSPPDAMSRARRHLGINYWANTICPQLKHVPVL